ncbi:alpha/beta hydrolase [Mycobacterium sp. Aquia_216]|uniref:alpha/beta fold hydrolase n=1 Tax=Mycobacterium sp. Aquia_216 TaxID=2991729 RepID=UPI00227B1625|nr:alpha/beta hydrolase [Mycobacterium sp. Aquia_216]WAJ43475.1 alpha/beta hydrolase [Mycobacterium sp. Aquia_216]
MAFVDADDGARIHVQDLGDGPAVVLISGFGLDHELWDRQVRVLTERGFRVLCVDQRGHGLSDNPLRGYEIDCLAADLITVLQRLDIGTATLVGHSFGGQMAFRAAATAPELITELVLVGSNGVRASRSEDFPFGGPPEPLLAGMIAEEHTNRVGSRYRTIASAFAHEPDPRTVEWLVRCSLRMPSWAAVACYRSLLTTDLLADIARVDQPVLQIIGTNDPVQSAKGARWVQKQLKNAALVEIPDCGHYPMLEAPDVFESALLEFVSA